MGCGAFEFKKIWNCLGPVSGLWLDKRMLTDVLRRRVELWVWHRQSKALVGNVLEFCASPRGLWAWRGQARGRVYS